MKSTSVFLRLRYASIERLLCNLISITEKDVKNKVNLMVSLQLERRTNRDKVSIVNVY